MLILGISGGFDLVHEKKYNFFTESVMHDAAAVLIDDGKIVSAIEEERLNRIKHSNKAPVMALRFCLKDYGVSLNDIDYLAVYGDEKWSNYRLRTYYRYNPEHHEYLDIRALTHKIISDAFNTDLDDNKVIFVPHHLAHATSSFYLSGFTSGLVMTMDGGGDDVSGMIYQGNDHSLEPIARLAELKSVGQFYLAVIRHLGYRLFDEYKVMGLAPYGDPNKYRKLFKQLYRLLPDGDFALLWDNLNLLFEISAPRKRKEPVTQIHQDIAAALQETLERIVFHVLEYYRTKTQQSNLCLAGGVAHNCTLNGKILYSGMFEQVFVQPAAHDAGCALGSALYIQHEKKAGLKFSKLEQVYWGNHIGNDDSIAAVLAKWQDLITFEKTEEITKVTAQLLADGSVIGWAQGRSEFGPRALGNRSILADPRPAKNKDIINEMVKKREAYRPFAPSVLEEYVGQYFELPENFKQFPFMIFVVKVRREMQKVLGATTHIDGTARIHSVAAGTNPLFWELIDEFRKITGIPVLLNTSFNNNAEPIVATAEDAIVSFLTTKLHYLVIGNYLVTKKALHDSDFVKLELSLPLYVNLNQTKSFVSNEEMITDFEIGLNYSEEYGCKISPELFHLLTQVDGKCSVAKLLTSGGITTADKISNLIPEILELWSKRLIRLEPV